ncbi:unnamed protein product [Triticum turgidum subsp. durum]|uniref:Trehalose 6-phosphate phosphatase n=1 Tax=Triticum turgidum subsp. durum TaxID=4567 RepID=A0A9R0ZXG7_TRITD|nr:unnamed protein product [Triticum turgidum subsp. durum]
MANQDVVLRPDMDGIAAAAAMPGSSNRAIFACRGAASTSLRRRSAVDDEFRAGSPCATSWVFQAMRASSPPRSPAVDEYAAWTMREAVRGVAQHFPAAIVTGRCVEKVCNFVGLSELYYAGSHGMDIKGPGSNAEEVLLQPAREFLPVIAEVYEALVEKTKTTPGARVENNKFCLSVHFRCVDEKRWSPLAEQVKEVLRDYPDLRLNEGRKVLEIRPSIMWDKGKAVEFLLQSLGFDGRSDVLPLYLGDDRTDEDAFKMLRKRGHGLGILVSKCPRETDASYSLQDPTEVYIHTYIMMQIPA